jgi:hypothetical protein
VQNGRCPPRYPSHGGEAHDEVLKMFGYTKVKLEKGLVDRIRRFAEIAGYSSPEEFITHALEKELAQLEDADSEEEIKKRLQGLGYMS